MGDEHSSRVGGDAGGPTDAVVAGLDGYARLTLVGRGGSASVYSATRVADAAEVAVKVFDAPDSSAYERQRRAGEKLRGVEGVLEVLDDVRLPDGRTCLVFPFAAGGSFADRMDRFGTTDPARVAELGAAVARALDAAHDAGVLHRDVKPSNVLIDGSGRPQLADFGAAASIEPATATDTMAVTIMYAAPEVLELGVADERSDVYSLGLTLMALASGSHPIGQEGDSGLAALVNRICTVGPPDPAELGCPEGLAAVLRRATALDPGERYPSAARFAEALDEAAGDPATAPTDSTTRPRAGATGARRARWLAATAAIAALLVLGGAALVLWNGPGASDASDAGAEVDRLGEPVTEANGILGPLYEQSYANYVGVLDPGCEDGQNLVELSIHAGPEDLERGVATPWEAVSGDGAGTFMSYMPCDTGIDEARYILGATGRWFVFVAEFDDEQYERMSTWMRENENSPSPDYTVDEDILATLEDPDVYRGWASIDQAAE
jgi:hypothetical protein